MRRFNLKSSIRTLKTLSVDNIEYHKLLEKFTKVSDIKYQLYKKTKAL